VILPSVAGRYPLPVGQDDIWTAERHLVSLPERVIDLYARFVELVSACGPFHLSVTKTAIAFKGPHRGFAGAKPRQSSLDGFLDLERRVRDERFRRVSPYTKKLYVHQFRITSLDQLDDPFAVWVHEAYAVGCGAHRESR
jgi:hypothetical protein